MDKVDRYSGNKRQRLCRSCFNYTLSIPCLNCREFSFLIENTINPHSLASDWWDTVTFILKEMLGNYIINTIKVAFTNIQSRIKTNGLLSDPFTLMQRVYQRFSVSIFLYIIVAEVRIQIRIQIGYHKIEIVNVTHNTTIFLIRLGFFDNK